MTTAAPPDPSTSMLDLSGTELEGRYRLLQLVGAGGMGTVYEGLHVVLGTKVAVKVLKPDLCANEKFRLRFLREARAASAIPSKHIVRITDFGTTPAGLDYFVMDYLVGQDLEQLLEARGRLTWKQFRPILLQTIEALDAAHAKGIVHRDIKPANIFLTDEDGDPLFVKMLDFGIAKLTSSEADGLTATDEMFGTVSYMAPEFAEGGAASPMSDIYSLGILMYQALTGCLPFEGGTPFQVLAKHLTQEPVPPRDHVPKIPVRVEAVILDMLAKKPTLRPATLADVLVRLEADSAKGAPPRARALPLPPLPPSPSTRAGRVTRSQTVVAHTGGTASPRSPSLTPSEVVAATQPIPPSPDDAIPAPRPRTGTAPATAAAVPHPMVDFPSSGVLVADRSTRPATSSTTALGELTRMLRSSDVFERSIRSRRRSTKILGICLVAIVLTIMIYTVWSTLTSKPARQIFYQASPTAASPAAAAP